jgi:Tol biopolymer transport system component
MAQNGALYSLNYGRFHQLTAEEGWTQPAVTFDQQYVIAVRRSGFYSDVFVLSRFGRVLEQLTHNAAPSGSYDTADNHWSFYPRLTPDGRTMFMSYDEPKGGYEVDMSVWAVPVGAPIEQGTNWTDAQGYTGGDMQPIPVRGGVIYTMYLRADDGTIHSQIWFTNRPSAYDLYAGKPLTTPFEDSREPSLSPDGSQIAMVCTYSRQVSVLEIGTWYGSSIGAKKFVITDQMVAQPVWAPDGSGIAYMAPALPDGPFQLFFLPSEAYLLPPPSPVPTPTPILGGPVGTPTPSPSPSSTPPPPVIKPIQVTSNVALDASSPLSWAP